MMVAPTVYTFDLEANGLLTEKDGHPPADRIWCATLKGWNDSEALHFGPDEIQEALGLLAKADLVIGHNIIGYDLPLIAKLYYPRFHEWSEAVPRWDTLITSQLCWPDIARPKGLTGKTGPHSIEAWGIRLGHHKPDYEDWWSGYTEEMGHRNIEDTLINEELARWMIDKTGTNFVQEMTG